MERPYCVAIPGDGLVQGEAFGLLFCYRGPDSDLDAEEILRYVIVEDAEKLVHELRSVRNVHEATLKRFAQSYVVDLRQVENINAFAIDVAHGQL